VARSGLVSEISKLNYELQSVGGVFCYLLNVKPCRKPLSTDKPLLHEERIPYDKVVHKK